VILRPVFFMKNLIAPFSLQSSTLARALGQDTKLQMIAVDDIGWFGARAFTDAAALNRHEIDLAGDTRTMAEAAEILTEALGPPITFAQTPIEQVRQHSKEMALMLEWFERVGYSADIAGLEREFGRTLTKLPQWARRQGDSSRTGMKGMRLLEYGGQLVFDDIPKPTIARDEILVKVKSTIFFGGRRP
jgi:uncharacterized protein YbjT (DUF2867 family)